MAVGGGMDGTAGALCCPGLLAVMVPEERRAGKAKPQGSVSFLCGFITFGYLE